ncbi:MAG: VWA domain-containing protein, partial [Planctomycetaceae bacterium]|nr:VWA domain-containing protein [Planctomycetaceae bacterium]
MITFIHPFAFIWLLLAIPLVLFYLWRARRPQAQVVTGALWQKAIPILHPRRAWQKQRWFVSLMTQLGILLILVTAMAEPCWRRPQRVVLVLDATSSMSVQSAGGTSRFDEAKTRAQQLVENMGYVDSFAVIAVGEKITIQSRMSHDRKQVLASLEKLSAIGGNAAVDEAVSMAKSLIKAGTGGTFDQETNHVILIS